MAWLSPNCNCRGALSELAVSDHVSHGGLLFEAVGATLQERIGMGRADSV